MGRTVAFRFFALVLVLTFCAPPSKGDGVYSEYREEDRSWTIGNPSIQVSFQLDSEGRFRLRSIDDATSRRIWSAPQASPSSPINLTVDGLSLNAETAYSVVSQSFLDITSPATGVRFSIVLSSRDVPGEVRFEADVYEGQPFFRYRTIYRNTSRAADYVTYADMLSWAFDDSQETYRDFFVGQWRQARAGNFEPHETDISLANGPVGMFTGSNGEHTAWRALRDSHDNGLVAAWEFNGRALSYVEHVRESEMVRLEAHITDLNHRVPPNGTFRVPDAFIGVFHGDWDDAGYRTQRFAEDVLAARFPDSEAFPYVMFDTWGYGEDIDLSTAINAAERAASLGAEVFILDYGWARQIGDWYPDPQKFPEGLRPLSDTVHSLGMKFGLHLPLLEVAPDAPVLKEHPDWEAVYPDRPTRYFGATSLCPSHRPARQWIISEAIRIIRDYDVDWVTQDGDNMVKICLSATHSHAPGDSNYSNAVDGLDTILAVVHAATPGVVWENCEDGGSMQTFKMVQQYVTSILNDSDDALTTRRAVYGGTYPFPLRYTERYMMDEPNSSYNTRSYMFGGPLTLMNRITRWSGSTMGFMKREVSLYKSVRELMRDGKVYHITAEPDGESSDAIEAHDEQNDRSLIFVYSNEEKPGVNFVQVRGLNADALYWVGFLEVPHSYIATGAQLMQKGIPVILPPWTAEVVSIVRR